MTSPLKGYKKNPLPILKRNSNTQLFPPVNPLSIKTSVGDKYLGNELQRLENTLSKGDIPEMSVTNFSVTRTADATTPDLTTTTNLLMTLIQDLKDAGVI